MTEYEQYKQGQKLYKTIVILSIICALLIFCAAGLYIYTSYLRNIQNNQAIPTVVQAVSPGFRQDEQPLLHRLFSDTEISTQHALPIVSICWDFGIFYDPITDKITLPSGVSVMSAEYNPAFYIHEITLSGAYLPRRHRLFLAYSSLIVSITQGGNTLTIRTQHPATVNICPDNSYLQLISKREIYHTIVIIDSGHGGLDTGANNVLGRNAPSESEIVLAITQKLLYVFDEPGILLIPTRTTNVHVDNSDRYRLANRVADYFISIHANACRRDRNSQGTLTLYGNAPGSAELAYALQTALVDALGTRDRGTEHAPEFRILRGSNVPVALLELMFMSNPTEAQRLSDPYTQMQIARTLANVISGLKAR